MSQEVRRVGRWLYRRAENILVALLAIMFIAFLIQIVFRYFLNFPIGWTTELTLITWLWLVLWGAAFVVTEKEEIRFDLVYGSATGRTRLMMSIIAGAFLIVMYGISFAPTLDYVLFMKVQQTAYLDIRFDILYFIYPIFAAAVIVRYGWMLWNGLRGKEPEPFDPTKASSGV